MKIIKRSNFDLELYREEVVAEKVNEYFGREMVDAWRRHFWSENSLGYLDLVEDDYVLYDGYKELMG